MTINIGDIDYSKELAKVGKLVQKLQNETEIVTKVDSWFTEFKDYIEGNGLVLDEGWLKSCMLASFVPSRIKQQCD